MDMHINYSKTYLMAFKTDNYYLTYLLRKLYLYTILAKGLKCMFCIDSTNVFYHQRM